MTSEKITMFRTNEDKTEIIEQFPKTISSQVYDFENEQFLDTTIEDINTEITEHKAQKGQPNGYASLDANGKVPSSQISIDGGGGVVEDASTTQKGIVKLNTSTNSTSTTEAATPSSVKAAYDLANGKYTKPQTGIPSSDLTSDVQATLNKVVDGTTTTKGIVQLTNSTSSTSTTTAATPSSVKTAYDLANGKYTKPTNGIPATDLESSIQTTLNKVVDGTISTKGLVQLTDSTTSISTSTAATPNSVKSAYDLANGKYSKPTNGIPVTDLESSIQTTLNKVVDGTTTTKGIVQLTNSATSTSTTTAATPSSVKTVNDALATHNNDYLKHGITGTSTGSANTYILTPSPALTAYTKGLRVTLFVNVANTGGSTLNINGLGAKILKKNTGSGFVSGDLGLNIPYTFVYNGTDFVLTDAISSSFGAITTTEVFDELNDQYLHDTLVNIVNDVATHGNDYLKHGISATTTGSANTYVLTPSPALSTYTKGLRITLFVNVANTGSSTLNINGLGVKTLKKNDGSTYGAGELKINTPYTFVYNGTDFLADSTGGREVGEATLEYVDFYTDVSAAYHLTGLQLSVARSALASTTVGDYALIGGGYDGNMNVDFSVVDAFNGSGIRTTPTALSYRKRELAATTVGNYALFSGGESDDYIEATVDAYNSSLTRTTPTALSTGRFNLAATTVGNYALFGGGYATISFAATATVDAYNSALVRTTPTVLSEARGQFAATTVGNYALFGGGYATTGSSATVDAYSSSLTRTIVTNLSSTRDALTATTVGNYAMFGGGTTGRYDETRPNVDVYTDSLVMQSSLYLSNHKQNLASASLTDYALFAGGNIADDNVADYLVDSFDKNLIRTNSDSLTMAREGLCATRLGDYILFSGGAAPTRTNTSAFEYFSNVDVYTVDKTASIQITSGSTYKFNNESEQTATSNLTLSYADKVNGYVKMKSGTVTS